MTVYVTAQVQYKRTQVPTTQSNLTPVVLNVYQEFYSCCRGLSHLLFSSNFRFRYMCTLISLIPLKEN